MPIVPSSASHGPQGAGGRLVVMRLEGRARRSVVRVWACAGSGSAAFAVAACAHIRAQGTCYGMGPARCCQFAGPAVCRAVCARIRAGRVRGLSRDCLPVAPGTQAPLWRAAAATCRRDLPCSYLSPSGRPGNRGILGVAPVAPGRRPPHLLRGVVFGSLQTAAEGQRGRAGAHVDMHWIISLVGLGDEPQFHRQAWSRIWRMPCRGCREREREGVSNYGQCRPTPPQIGTSRARAVKPRAKAGRKRSKCGRSLARFGGTLRGSVGLWTVLSSFPNRPRLHCGGGQRCIWGRALSDLAH